jgi:invasion protein IalB
MKTSIAALCALLCLAVAQAPSAAQTASSRVSISGWHLECNPSGANLTCRILNQITQTPGGGLLLGFTLNQGVKGATNLTLEVPLGAAVNAPVTLNMGNGVTQDFPFVTCSQQGCYAAAAVDAALLKAMRDGKAQMKATYTLLDTNLAPHAVTVSLPLTGFSEVYDKLGT